MTAKENADSLMAYAQAQGIVDKKELANFMGQMQVESRNFTSFEESLHYSAERLYAVFPGRNGMDSIEKASDIVKGGAENIANAMYGGDWGESNLGNVEPDDGWRYRGRGYVQITGREHYDKIGQELGLDLVHHPDSVTEPDIAAKTAVQYWKDRVVRYGHQSDADEATKAINSASKGLHERRAAAAAWEFKLEHGHVPGASIEEASRTLKQGMRGDDVRHAQEQLHDLGYLKADPNGRFGPATKAAVQAFQRDDGLDDDGKIGAKTGKQLDSEAVHEHIAASSVDGSDSLDGAAPDFSDPRHRQNPLYCLLKETLPQGTSELRLAQSTAACYMAGIKKPEDLSGIYIGDTTVAFTSASLFARPAQIDISQPAPSIQQTMLQVRQHDQEQAHVAQQLQEQKQHHQSAAIAAPTR
jgi:putative chitinase